MWEVLSIEPQKGGSFNTNLPAFPDFHNRLTIQ